MNFDPLSQWQTLASQAFASLWPQREAPASAFGAFADVTERFSAAATAFLAAGAANGGARAAAEAFSRFLREQFATLHTAGSAAGHPPYTEEVAIGASREHQQRLQRIAAAAAAMEAAQRRLQLLWADALREASTAYCSTLGATSSGAVTPEILRGLYDRWIDCAEEAYARMAHSEAYCDALADYVNAGSQWRSGLQESLEQWAQLLDLPTRSELNTLIQRVNALEAALRRPPQSPQSPKSSKLRRPATAAPRARQSRRKPKR